MSPLQIASVCHEANRAFCETIGDHSQVSFERAPDWQVQSAVNGVEFVQAHPDAPDSAAHDNWLKEKLADGWKYGLIKSVRRKEHPCCVAFDDLPVEQQTKDRLFCAIVRALSGNEE